MVRDDLDNIPEVPLPPGIEVRPVRREDLRRIWDAAREALRDENNFFEENWDEQAFKRLPSERLFTPELWQIAWDGEEVVGGVHNFVDRAENESLGRKWGHTEHIFVRRQWRGRGVARALISRSLKVVKEQGMEAATLDVDAENPSRALKLYESLGYRMCREFTFYRKPL
jgi:ribosomal protein S18 acetylase RimI-like enzyme